MKIALSCPASLPATQFGGILFLAVDIAKELSQQGHDVTIYTTDLDFANNAKTFNKKLPRFEVIQKFKIKRSHVLFSIHLFYVNPWMYFQIIKDSPDIIHTIGTRSFQSFVSMIVSKKKNIPLVISDQGGLTTHPDLKDGSIIKKILYNLQKPLLQLIINQAKKIIVANEYEKEIFSKFCEDTKITIIRNGIDLDILKSQTLNFKEKYKIDTRFFLFLGRFSKVKGIDILLKAISLIKDEPVMTTAKLVIMGVDFGFESKMLQMIKDLKIEKHVIVIKNPSREDVISAYKESEFLVLPSRWELSPLTPLEGFAFKKAVISANVHGIPYTIKNKENGLLVESENAELLAKAIIDLLTDKKKCSEYGMAGYNYVLDVGNSKAMAENTLQLYKQIIHN